MALMYSKWNHTTAPIVAAAVCDLLCKAFGQNRGGGLIRGPREASSISQCKIWLK